MRPVDRLFWTWLCHLWPGWRHALVIVKQEDESWFELTPFERIVAGHDGDPVQSLSKTVHPEVAGPKLQQNLFRESLQAQSRKVERKPGGTAAISKSVSSADGEGTEG